MKCKDCPLCVDDGSYDACGDYDLLCLADWKTQSFPNKPEFFDTDNNGCTRTNKWILAQDKEALKNKHFKFDCDCWANAYKEMEDYCDDGNTAIKCIKGTAQYFVNKAKAELAKEQTHE